MEGFLGTAIQYSEQQILLLEQQHAANQEKTVRELIESGFLDSDYESTENEWESTENELTDSEPEIKENVTLSDEFELDDLNIPTTPTQNNNLSLTLPSNNHQSLEKIEFKSIQYLLEIILTDVKSLLLLFILMIALPHIIDRGHNSDSNISNATYECPQHKFSRAHYLQTKTSIYWFYDTPKTSIINEEEEEREEYHTEQCRNNKLIFDIMTTTVDTQTNKIFSAKLTHHSVRITPCRKDFMPQEIPRLFFSFGAGLRVKSPQMVRVFKETVIGTQFTRTHGLTALVLSLVGIVAFAAANTNSEAQFVEIM